MVHLSVIGAAHTTLPGGEGVLQFFFFFLFFFFSGRSHSPKQSVMAMLHNFYIVSNEKAKA